MYTPANICWIASTPNIRGIAAVLLIIPPRYRVGDISAATVMRLNSVLFFIISPFFTNMTLDIL